MHDIAVFPVFGFPLVFHLGVLNFLVLLGTVAIPLLRRYGLPSLPFRWHPRFAYFLVVVSIVHGLLAWSFLVPF